MSNQKQANCVGLNDLLGLFEEHISVADISAARYLGKISAAIVKKRMELHMTQKEFAEYIKVSQGMVSKWESGDYNFSIKALAEIAEKLNMELYINFKSSGEKSKELSVQRDSNYIFAASVQSDDIDTKGNVIRFEDKQSYLHKKQKFL